MKHFMIFLSIVLTICLIYLMAINASTSFSLKLLYSANLQEQLQSGVTQQLPYFIKDCSFILYSVITFVSGLLVGSSILYCFLSVQKDKVKAYKRELERSSVADMNSSSKVEVLEAKIKTLEKAFDSVIDERKQLEIQIDALNTELENKKK